MTLLDIVWNRTSFLLKENKYFTQITELIVARSAANGGRSVLRSLGESGLRRIGAMRPLEAMVPIPASIDKLFTAANSTFEF